MPAASSPSPGRPSPVTASRFPRGRAQPQPTAVGNETEEIFRHRDDVLYASIHQAKMFPHSGPLRDAGSGAGLGYTINLPVPAGSDGELWLLLLEHVMLPAATAFGPELVLISTGFDAHLADPLGGCQLEGGSDPPALAESVIATMRALGGDGKAESIAPERIYTGRAASYVGTTGTCSQPTAPLEPTRSTNGRCEHAARALNSRPIAGTGLPARAVQPGLA